MTTGRRILFGCLCGALVALHGETAAEARGARNASLRVHVERNQYVPSDMGQGPPTWTPQPNRIVHVAIGEAWEDSAVTDAMGNAWFPRVPSGHAKLWCNPHPFAGNPETVNSGGEIDLRPRSTVTDTVWLQCVVRGLFR